MRARLITATASPPLNASAQRTAEGGMGSPLDAMSTDALWVGWSSHFFFPIRSRPVPRGSLRPRSDARCAHRSVSPLMADMGEIGLTSDAMAGCARTGSPMAGSRSIPPGDPTTTGSEPSGARPSRLSVIRRQKCSGT